MTNPKERPILFSGEMVRAIVSGQKTQTRRIIKPRYPVTVCRADGIEWPGFVNELGDWELMRCPYGEPGDRLWVRETWAPIRDALTGAEQPGRFLYRADACDNSGARWHNCKPGDPKGEVTWKPSIHMPRLASRITLEITGVRVERLQEISEEGARAEGVDESIVLPGDRGSFVPSFANLWHQINGAESWDANPWVWVVEFRRCG